MLMKFLKVLTKEKSNLNCACKRQVLQQSWSLATSLKKDSSTGIFLGTPQNLCVQLFYRTTPVAAFALSFSIRK